MSTVFASLDADALIHNLKVLRRIAPHARVSAVVKDNAYGHGIEEIAKRIHHFVDAYCVATLAEGLELRRLIATKPIWILLGYHSRSDLRRMVSSNLTPVIHSEYQISILRREKLRVQAIFEVDTGMGRLGFHHRDATAFLKKVQEVADVKLLMSHLACADEMENAFSEEQMHRFTQFSDLLSIPKSIANSGGIISVNNYQLDWIRPGLLVYGVTPLVTKSSKSLGLRPVMTLTAQLIAIRQMSRGDSVGYGATFTCPEDMPVGIVGCGYGDGYPRSLGSDAIVGLNRGFVKILGRVSMDSMAIDLRGVGDANIGDQILLWGGDLPIEAVAKNAGTIPNELLTRLTSRVVRRWT